ncbi:MAG TPA: AraC family transcriptional regulator [Tepidisphaeraceae bacterium]
MSDRQLPPVERWVPFERLTPRRVYNLPLEHIRPVIHLAHYWDLLPETPDRRIIVDHELILPMKGGGMIEMESGSVKYQAGELLYFPPFLPHTVKRIPGINGEHLAVHFDWAPHVPKREQLEMRRAYEVRLAGGVEIPARHPLPAGHRVEREFWNVVRGWSSGEALGRFEAMAALTSMIAWILRDASQVTNSNPSELRNRERVDRVVAYAKKNLTRSFSADELADVAGVSRGRLTALFRSATGYSLSEHIRLLRIDEAKRLLADMDLSVKEIAAKTGFADVYHFSHAFTKLVGLSATQYRQLLLTNRR